MVKNLEIIQMFIHRERNCDTSHTTEYYTILKMNGHNNIDECQEHNVTEEYKAAGNFIHIPVPGTHHNGP